MATSVYQEGSVTNTSGALTVNAVVIGNGGNDEKVLAALGASGTILTSNGSSLPPSFQAAPAAGLAPSYTAQTGTYAAAANDFVDCTSGSFTVTLPLSSSNANKAIWIVNSGAGTITIGRTSSDTIGNQSGQTSQTLNPGDEMTMLSSGTGVWRIT